MEDSYNKLVNFNNQNKQMQGLLVIIIKEVDYSKGMALIMDLKYKEIQSISILEIINNVCIHRCYITNINLLKNKELIYYI